MPQPTRISGPLRHATAPVTRPATSEPSAHMPSSGRRAPWRPAPPRTRRSPPRWSRTRAPSATQTTTRAHAATASAPVATGVRAVAGGSVARWVESRGRRPARTPSRPPARPPGPTRWPGPSPRRAGHEERLVDHGLERVRGLHRRRRRARRPAGPDQAPIWGSAPPATAARVWMPAASSPPRPPTSSAPAPTTQIVSAGRQHPVLAEPVHQPSVHDRQQGVRDEVRRHHGAGQRRRSRPPSETSSTMPRLTIAIGSRPKKPARENCQAPGTERTRRYGDSTGPSVHTGPVPGRLVYLLLGVVLLTSVAGCSSDDADRPDAPAPGRDVLQPAPDRRRQRPRQPPGGQREPTRPAQVTEIGLDSDGYGEYVEEHDSLIQPGQTIDLRMTLPEPVCDASPTPAYGIVTIGGTRVREKLDRFGQDFVESLWRRTLQPALGHHVADLAWRFDHDAVGTGRASYLRGTLEVTRKPGTTTPLRVEGMQGSVLFRLQPTARPPLGPDDDSVRVPLRRALGALRRARDLGVQPDVPLEAGHQRRRPGTRADHHHRRRRRQGTAAGLPQEGLCLTS